MTYVGNLNDDYARQEPEALAALAVRELRRVHKTAIDTGNRELEKRLQDLVRESYNAFGPLDSTDASIRPLAQRLRAEVAEQQVSRIRADESSRARAAVASDYQHSFAEREERLAWLEQDVASREHELADALADIERQRDELDRREASLSRFQRRQLRRARATEAAPAPEPAPEPVRQQTIGGGSGVTG